MEIILTYIIGVIIGSILTSIVFRFRFPYYGTLKIDKSNPEKDIYRLEIKELDNIDKRRHIILDINTSIDLSQK